MTGAEPAVTAPTITLPLDDSPLRRAVGAATRRPEPELLPALLDEARLPADAAARTRALALRLARAVRERTREGGRAGLVQGLLQEFALSSQEGVALMCLAEALLRIPDDATRDALIRDKIGQGDWQRHLGRSPSIFVNAATWGLLLTGRIVATHSDRGLAAALGRIVGRGGEALVRKGVDLAMRMMGEQFVTGQTIEEALTNARRREADGFRHSYDMLGEAALTAQDAERYFSAYEHAIGAIGAAAAGRGIVDGPGISIKLSALHPRYARAQIERVRAELAPRLAHLARLARSFDIGLHIDAEESERLELSLELLEALCADPSLAGWNGLGFVVQAYSKRGPAVVEFLIDLARRTRRRLPVRLVKGAYWDSEIKRAQQEGQAGYTVYTRKPHTDIAYVACARRLLAAPQAIYPQFATHNARTLATIVELADPARWHPGQYEFQCLHGMGEPLYEQVVRQEGAGGLGRPCRIYAPVGPHDTLLAYLVRRLLENGANTSFVNRIASDEVPLESLVEDPVDAVLAIARAEGAIDTPGAPHPAIPLPPALFGAPDEARANSTGLDLNDEAQLASLARTHAASRAASRAASTADPTAGLIAASGADLRADSGAGSGAGPPEAGPTTTAMPATDARWHEVRNPADPADRVGRVRHAGAADTAAALAQAEAAQPAWAATPPAERAARLEAAAARLQDGIEPLCALLVREAGKTWPNAVAEVREAVDFLRYYATEVRRDFDPATHHALGPVVCISPWNFPLAIFTGQVAAALAAGNVVLAKPAEQTPLVAAQAVRALHGAGVPRGALQLVPGDGPTVGAALVADARVQGVLFTGSTEVARMLQRQLAGRLTPRGQPVPLVAETGGCNAMVVDSSALLEQVVQDVLVSAFDSAGQRCSALRLLCVQTDVAERLLEMLLGAMREQVLGDPARLATDVGPLIDAEARAAIERHVEAMRARGHRVWQPLAAQVPGMPGTQAVPQEPPGPASGGNFVAATLIEIASAAELGREVFGPVLHLLRYERDGLPALLDQVNAAGYGLTGGVHTRIDEQVVRVVQGPGPLRAGNLYVNRNVVGAVVGVQPFGGEGLSGTGPKAGGPLYLLRLLAVRPADAARRAVQAAGPRAAAPGQGFDVEGADAEAQRAFVALQAWAAERQDGALGGACTRAASASPVLGWRALAGPTGEANLYAVRPREAVLCLADDDDTRLAMLAAVLAVGARAVWPVRARAQRDALPGEVRERIALAQDWRLPSVRFDTLLHAGPDDALRELIATLASRPGPIVPVARLGPDAGRDPPLERLVTERSLAVNTAAAGGNASLMAIG